MLLMLKRAPLRGAAGENGAIDMASLQAHRGKRTEPTALFGSTPWRSRLVCRVTIFSIGRRSRSTRSGAQRNQFGLLIGTPILTGSLIRLVLGVWTEQYGGRVVNLVVMLAAARRRTCFSYAHTYEQFLLAALWASASLAVRSQSASPMSLSSIRRASRALRSAFRRRQCRCSRHQVRCAVRAARLRLGKRSRNIGPPALR